MIPNMIQGLIPSLIQTFSPFFSSSYREVWQDIAPFEERLQADQAEKVKKADPSPRLPRAIQGV